MQLTSKPPEARSDNRSLALMERDVMSEEAFLALQARLSRMSDTQLAEFRADPANHAIVRQYDGYALRQVLPYLVPLILVSVASIVAGMLLTA